MNIPVAEFTDLLQEGNQRSHAVLMHHNLTDTRPSIHCDIPEGSQCSLPHSPIDIQHKRSHDPQHITLNDLLHGFRVIDQVRDGGTRTLTTLHGVILELFPQTEELTEHLRPNGFGRAIKSYLFNQASHSASSATEGLSPLCIWFSHGSQASQPGCFACTWLLGFPHDKF